jgi:hypothetical protein
VREQPAPARKVSIRGVNHEKFLTPWRASLYAPRYPIQV